MATIHVDGKEYEVNGADNLLEACLSLGLDIPYFCWQPALGSVGADVYKRQKLLLSGINE